MFFKVLESSQISDGHRLAFFTIATTVTMEIGQSTVVLVAERMRVRPKLKCVRCEAQGTKIVYSFSCSSVCRFNKKNSKETRAFFQARKNGAAFLRRPPFQELFFANWQQTKLRFSSLYFAQMQLPAFHSNRSLRAASRLR
jgi:hypothetical protein